MAKKLVLVGDGASGKTAFSHLLLGHQVPQHYVATLGVEVHPFKMNDMTVNIWDTAGQERFGGLRSGYYLQADGAILVYDSRKDPQGEEHWLSEVREMAPGVKMMAVATHFDGSQTVAQKVNAYTDTVLLPNFGALSFPMDLYSTDLTADEILLPIVELFN